MARWIIKFQIKKVALTIKPQILLELHDQRDHEVLTKVQNHLDRIQYLENLKSFKQETLLNYFTGIITVNPTGAGDLRSTEALRPFFE